MGPKKETDPQGYNVRMEDTRLCVGKSGLMGKEDPRGLVVEDREPVIDDVR